MSKTRGVIYGSIIALVGLTLWFIRRHIDARVDRSITSKILPAADKEKLIIDPRHHTIEVLNRKSNGDTQIQRKYLNPRGPTAIEEKQDGSIVVTQRAYGTELSVFAGVGMGTDVQPRAAVGLNLYYVHSFDFGMGFLATSDVVHDSRAMVEASYNFIDNLSIGVYVDNRKDAGVLATVRF